MDSNGNPSGGSWSFDRFNRQPLRRYESKSIPKPISFQPNEITQGVLTMVQKRFSNHPGRLDHFTLPVTRRDALRMLADFVEARLANFGPFQDAMSVGEPFLYHTRLSTSLNLKLLSPRECVEAAVTAYENSTAPIQSVEGYVRQILGWREFMRGTYWLHMPKYSGMNALGHDLDVPSFYWNGDTEMNCVRQTMSSILDHGYAHHIQRLMVVGLFALLLGVHPRQVS